jgi:protocatechuate 3,4-dioxygenase beta subunit
MVSRRRFLVAAAVLLGGAGGGARRLRAQGGLDQFAVSAPPCGPDTALTAAVPPDASFRAGSPARTSLLEPGLDGRHVVLQGTVSGTRCGRVAEAVVDLWQADSHGVVDLSGNRLRGYQRTNAAGMYRFLTIAPGAAGSRAPHFGLRVRPPGKTDFWTEAFLPDSPGNRRDPRFTPALAAKRSELGPGGADTYLFDIVLDL